MTMTLIKYDDYHSKDVCPFDPREFSPSASQTRTIRTKHRNYLWTHISMQFPIQSCAPVQGEAIHISVHLISIRLGESVSLYI